MCDRPYMPGDDPMLKIEPWEYQTENPKCLDGGFSDPDADDFDDDDDDDDDYTEEDMERDGEPWS